MGPYLSCCRSISGRRRNYSIVSSVIAQRLSITSLPMVCTVFLNTFALSGRSCSNTLSEPMSFFVVYRNVGTRDGGYSRSCRWCTTDEDLRWISKWSLFAFQLNKRLIEEVNIDGVRNTLTACNEANVERFIYTSTYNTVYGGQQILNGNEDNTKFLPIYKVFGALQVFQWNYVCYNRFFYSHLAASRSLCADQVDKRAACADGWS